MSKLAPFAVLLCFVIAACNFPGFQQQSDGDNQATAAAETVSAQLTRVSSTQPAPEPTEPEPLSATATPSAEPQPTESPTPDCTNEVAFVEDVTIPDDTVIPAGDTFDKIWRLRNDGSCTWTTEYDVVFDSGNIMAGPPSSPLPSNVPPGGSVDIEISLTAPGSDGTHRGEWKLRTADGVVFGLGDDNDKPFFVQIVVGAEPPEVVYDFVENYCDATWQTGAGELPCPGSDSDAEGFVLKLDSPQLEDGRTENEPALITHPEWVNNGVISGTFPAFNVEEGDEFHAVIGCLFDAVACDVTMQLNYKQDGGVLTPLREWTESYDGDFRIVEVDLSSLAGSSVEFSLAVLADGAFNEDQAFWLAPRIIGNPR